MSPHDLLKLGAPRYEVAALLWVHYEHSDIETPIEVLITCAPGANNQASLPRLADRPKVLDIALTESGRDHPTLDAGWGRRIGFASSAVGKQIILSYLSSRGDLLDQLRTPARRRRISTRTSLREAFAAVQVCEECLYPMGGRHRSDEACTITTTLSAETATWAGERGAARALAGLPLAEPGQYGDQW